MSILSRILIDFDANLCYYETNVFLLIFWLNLSRDLMSLKIQPKYQPKKQ